SMVFLSWPIPFFITTRDVVLRKRLVLVVAAPPDARLVTPFGRAVEPLVHPPEAVDATRIGGIGMVDATVFEHERAHARPLAHVCGHIGATHGRKFGGPIRRRARGHVGAGPLLAVGLQWR